MNGEVTISKGQAVQLSLHSVKTQKTFFLFNKLPYASTETVAHPYTPEKSVNLFTKSMEYSHIWEGFSGVKNRGRWDMRWQPYKLQYNVYSQGD